MPAPDLQSIDAAQMDYVLDLRTVLKAVLKWSWIAVIFTLIGVVYGTLETAKFVPEYTAKIVIAPQSPKGNTAGSLQPARGNGLTTTLLTALGNPGAEPGGMFERLRFAFKSQQLARRLDEQYSLSQEIFAGRWDVEKGVWKTAVSVEPTFFEQLDIYLHQDQANILGTEALAMAVGGMVKFEPIKKTQFWEISVSHTDRDTALRRLKIIFSAADQLLRQQDREKMLEQIAFLRTRTEKSDLAGFRAAIFGALIQQEKNLHMIDSDLIYSADIVEPAFASEMKSKPNLMKTILVPAVGGGFVGLVLVLLVSVFLRE